MVCTCSQIFLIRTVYTFLSSRITALKKKLQYTSKVFIYLKSTIPCVPLRSLLFQVLLVFILVACYFLISGPACSCCSSPYRWNKQESLSHSQEYSWSADWQSGRTTCKKTEIWKFKSRNNQNSRFPVFSKNWFYGRWAQYTFRQTCTNSNSHLATQWRQWLGQHENRVVL